MQQPGLTASGKSVASMGARRGHVSAREGWRRPRVLLIDDDADLRMALAESLRMKGFDVAAAADGRAGLDAFAEQRPDVVVTDVQMPEVDGIEVVRHIAKIAPEVPVIAMSSRAQYLDHCLTFGAVQVLQKPFGLAELIAALKTTLAQAA